MDTPQAPPTASVPDDPPKSKRVGANTVAPPPPDVDLLTFGEAAYLLRVSVTTVRRAVDEGHLRMVQLLGRTLIARAAVADFIRASDLAKSPTSGAVAALAAESKPSVGQRGRARVVADWNTGDDVLDLEGYLAGRPDRTRSSKSGA